MANSLQNAIILMICVQISISKEVELNKSEIIFDNFGITNINAINLIDNATVTKRISVSSNPIPRLDQNYLKSAPNLEVFIMNNNSDYQFPVNNASLKHPNLREISLNYCVIKVIYKETFADLPNLTSLSMDHNLIETLDSSMFAKNPKLKYLYVSSNRIKSIEPMLLRDKTSFEELKMNFNRNFNFDPSRIFLENKNLAVFECEYCNVTRIYVETFSKLPNLKRLILNHNNISHIELNSFKTNYGLKVIELNNNSLQSLPLDIFSDNLSILHIDLNKFVPSAENNILKMSYMSKKYRSPNSSVAERDYFENNLKDFVVPTPSTSPPVYTFLDDECKNLNVPILKDGISDAFISTYLTLIVIAQIIVLVLTISCWIKKSREESAEYIDYSKTVLNEHDIYKMN